MLMMGYLSWEQAGGICLNLTGQQHHQNYIMINVLYNDKYLLKLMVIEQIDLMIIDELVLAI